MSRTLRREDKIYLTYWTTARGDEVMSPSFGLLDMTAHGRREEWEDSPEGWPQFPTHFVLRTDEHGALGGDPETAVDRCPSGRARASSGSAYKPGSELPAAVQTADFWCGDLDGPAARPACDSGARDHDMAPGADSAVGLRRHGRRVGAGITCVASPLRIGGGWLSVSRSNLSSAVQFPHGRDPPVAGRLVRP